MSRAATFETPFETKVLRAAEQFRPDVAAHREIWKLMQSGFDPEKLVFLDETCAKTNMTRPRGRALCGERLVCHAPFGHRKTTTFLAGLRLNGLIAPLVIDGAVNGAVFVNYVRQHLATVLHSEDILIMDNLNSHKVAGVHEAIEEVGARVLYLPPPCLDFNPIEQVFSKLKWLLCRSGCRTVDALWETCGQLLDRFPAHECANYLKHCGYRYT